MNFSPLWSVTVAEMTDVSFPCGPAPGQVGGALCVWNSVLSLGQSFQLPSLCRPACRGLFFVLPRPGLLLCVQLPPWTGPQRVSRVPSPSPSFAGLLFVSSSACVAFLVFVSQGFQGTHVHRCASFSMHAPRRCTDGLLWSLWSLWSSSPLGPGFCVGSLGLALRGAGALWPLPRARAAWPCAAAVLCGVTWKQLPELGSTLFWGRPGVGRALLWLATLWLAFESWVLCRPPVTTPSLLLPGDSCWAPRDGGGQGAACSGCSWGGSACGCAAHPSPPALSSFLQREGP